jgi:CRISPR system Cascade subunit CasC
MNLVEVHVIQTVAPSNLNRDDTGSPKDAPFGGVRRARLSSQSQKRAVRDYFRDRLVSSLFSPEDLAVRTRRLPDALVEKLRDRPPEAVRAAVGAALRTLGFEVTGDGVTQYLFFLGTRKLDRLAELVREHWNVLTAPVDRRKAQDPGSGRARRRSAKPEAPEDLVRTLSEVLHGDKAIDLALFGRMLADDPRWGVDGAAQVAHAISTHRVDREFDFYTAVDDLQAREETGAGMMGDVEFVSATFYRYANINLDQLRKNLDGDIDLAVKGVCGFLEAFVLTLPKGKQNSFAAHNPPVFVAFLVRRDAMPRNLLGAFERPVRESLDRSLAGVSVEHLLRHWQRLDCAYGTPDGEQVALVNISDGEVVYHAADRVESLKDALQRIEPAIRRLVGGAP